MMRHAFRPLVLLTALAVIVAGSASAALAAVKPATVTPVSSELLPPEQTISLELKGTDIRDALEALAKLTGTNIIADQGVVGNITVTLNEVPFQKALDLIIKANGFSYKWVGNIVVVAKSDRLDEALDSTAVQTFTLKHAKPQDMVKALSLVLPASNIIVEERTRSLIVKGAPGALASVKQMLNMLDVEEAEVTRVFPLKGAISDGLKLAVEAAVPNGELKVGPAGRSLIITATPTELAEVDRLVANLDKEENLTEVYPLRYANPDDLKLMLENAVPGGLVTTGPGGKSLMVRGTRSQLAQVAKIVAGLDQAAAPLQEQGSTAAQAAPAATEVRTYQLKYANTDDVKAAVLLLVPASSVGIGKKDRAILVKGTPEVLNKVDEIVAKLDAPARQVILETRVEELSVNASRQLGLDWTFPLELQKDPFDVMKVVKVVSDFSADLTALETDGDATMLANPRVAVVDGKDATIHIGDRIPVVVQKRSGEGDDATVTEEVQFIEAGILLKVLPRFNDDKTLTVQVNPEVSTITGQTPQGYPSIRTRSAQTTMILRDGETVAIGGLVSQNQIDTVRKTPVLGDVPLLGRLFQVKGKENKQTEIVIFLTTRVVPVDGVPAATTK